MKQNDILFVLNSSCGGSERMTLLYAKILAKKGFSCHLLILQNSISRIFTIESFIPLEIPYTLLSSRARFLPLKLRRKLRELSSPVIFSSLTPISNYLLIYKCLGLVKSRLVIRVNNNPLRIKEVSALHYRLFALVGRMADVVISQTDEMRYDAIRHFHIPEKKIVTIINPVDLCNIGQLLQEKSPLDKDYVNFLAAGRLNPIKDYATLIKAFYEVQKTINKSRLYILGETSNTCYYEELKALVEKLKIQKSVFFEGFQTNPYKYMHDCSVFVHSSKMEGLPNVLLEAMSIGKPVVATDCIPIISRMINDGTNGYIVSVGDDKTMAHRMIDALSLSVSSTNVGEEQEQILNNIFTYLAADLTRGRQQRRGITDGDAMHYMNV